MHISEYIQEMLQNTPHNCPPISTLDSLFNYTVLDPIILRNLDDIGSISEYSLWKRFVGENSELL